MDIHGQKAVLLVTSRANVAVSDKTQKSRRTVKHGVEMRGNKPMSNIFCYLLSLTVYLKKGATTFISIGDCEKENDLRTKC